MAVEPFYCGFCRAFHRSLRMRLQCAAWLAGLALAWCGAPVVAAGPDAAAAAHVLNRLAYGPKPGDIERVARGGVRRYIAEQLDPAFLAQPLPAPLAARLAALDTVHSPAGAVLGQFLAVRDMARDETEQARDARRAVLERIARQAAEARLARALDSPRQLEEVLVDFWYNHFNVFAGKGVDRALVASYERDAIRPHAFGPFRALLGATATHPAMLHYLDNAASRAGALNENYARELMELHTLGVDEGYTQRDVTELARMLTGWSYNQRALVERNETFRFDPRRHDQGGKRWLGRDIAPAGQAEGEAALDVLAMHPATARHVSAKLARYFVQDEPPPALVERMARTWLAHGGDIRAVLRTLFDSEEFMAPAARGAKFKTPYRYVLSAMRATARGDGDDEGNQDAGAVNVAPDPFKPMLNALNALGMPLYGCQTPDGYKNTEQAWLNPDALSRRIGYAASLAAGADAAALQTGLAPTLSARTVAIVDASPASLRAAMLLGSPDFMQH